MKTFKQYILVLLTAATVWGCDGFLDKNPTDQLSSESFWRSKGDYDKALASV